MKLNKLVALFFVSVLIGCTSKSTDNSNNVKMREMGSNLASNSVNSQGITIFNSTAASPTTNVGSANTSGVVGAATWCTIDNITLKQIFLKPDSCDSCGHSFLVSDSQYTSANHDFVSDSVIGIDIDADKGDGNGPKEIRMDDISIFSDAYPYNERQKEKVFTGNSVQYTLPFGDGSNCSMIIILDFGNFN